MQIFRKNQNSDYRKATGTTNTNFDICRLKIKHANKNGDHIY